MEVIREADANADIVLACVHWGTEYSTVLEEVQMTTGKLYLDAMLLNIHISGTKENPQIEVQVIPAIQKNNCTYIFTEQESKEELFGYLESISYNIEIDESGLVKLSR